MAGILPQYYQDYVRGKISYAQATGQQTPTPAPTAPAPTPSSSSSKPSWMGSMYSQVPGTNWYSTNPLNPNAAKYNADGTPVASVSYSNQQTGTNFSGYANPQQFQQIVTNAQAGNPAGNNSLYEDWIKSGQLVSNQSIYGNNPTYPTSSATVPNTPATHGVMSTATAPAASGQSVMLTPSSTTPPYADVYDTNFLNKSPEERLAAFKANPQLAQQEIARDKDLYMQALKSGASQDRLNQIHTWADQVRTAANIRNDDAVYGNADNSAPTVPAGMNAPTTVPNPTGTGNPTTPASTGPGTPTGTGTPVGTTPTGTSVAGAASNPAAQAQNQQLSNTILQMLQEAQDPNNPYWNNMRNQAALSAAQIVQGKQQQLDAARHGLDDKYFQQYLQARQGMANRGLGNSGLANDADFRLQLAKQGDLGQMYANLGTFDKSQITNDEFQKLYSDASKNMLQGAGTMADMYKANLPYTAPTADAVLGANTEYAKMAQDQNQFNAKLGWQQQMDLANLGFNYASLNSKDRQFFAQLNSDDAYKAAQIQVQLQKNGIDLANVMGKDAQGNLTLDAQKLQEQAKEHNLDVTFKYDELGAQVQNWTAQNSLKKSDLDLGYAQLSQKTGYDNQMIQNMSANAKNDLQKTALDALGRQQQQIASLISSRLSADPKADVSSLIDQYNSTMGQVNQLLGKM